MDPLITICARSGSQGVKNKNIRPLLGRPLIAHSIDCAMRWGRADRVVVSTDSEDIARVARACGAETPFIRPASLAGGNVPKMAVVRHALHQIEQGTDKRYEVVIDLDVTAPLRHVSDVENAFNLLIDPSTAHGILRGSCSEESVLQRCRGRLRRFRARRERVR